MTKNLLQLGFISSSRGLKTISVIGSGLMGSGIAQVVAQGGYSVTLVDVDEQLLTDSMKNIKNSLRRVAAKMYANDSESAEHYFNSSISKIHTTINLKNSVRESDLVVEAIVEKLNAKHDLFKMLDKYAREDCILVSNTSSLPLKEIGSILRLENRFAGLHFFNPVTVLKLVEVIRTSETSDSVFEVLINFVKSLNKVPVACRDTPGFIVNRLLVPYLLESIRLFERGDATVSDIDQGMKLGAGHPMGPLELADFIGLDTIKFICDSFGSLLPNDAIFCCPEILQNMVKEGKLGKKSCLGFYNYDAQGRILR